MGVDLEWFKALVLRNCIIMMKRSHKVRQSNFELLRIIAMLLIVLHHSMVHGTLRTSGKLVLDTGNPITFAIYNFLAFGGKVGVYIFVLITGYFMINSKISIKKIVKLWLPIFFWAVTITLSYELVTSNFSIGEVVRSVFPIFFNQYWFMTVYFFMYLLIPLMNKAIRSFSIKQELWFIALGIVIMLPNEFFYGAIIGGQLINFVIVYFIGAFISEHGLLWKKWFKKISYWSCWLSVIMILLTSIGFSFAGFSLKSMKLLKDASFLTDGETQTFFCLFIALGLFVWIGSKNLGYHKFINTVAGTTFGIYLIHDNKFVHAILWNKVCHMNSLIGMPIYGVVYVIVVVMSVFAACSLLEFIRKQIFNKLEKRVADKLDTFGSQVLNQVLGNVNID